MASVTFGSMGMKRKRNGSDRRRNLCRKRYYERTVPQSLVMDQAGDVLADAINEAYGDALVTSLILPELFFNGFPFVFEIYYEGARRPAHIRIIPEEEY